MQNSNRPAWTRAGPVGLCVAATLLATVSALAWPVSAGGDAAPTGAGAVTIDNFTAKSTDGDVFTIARVEVDGANLSKDEIVKLLTPDTPADEELALARKLKADKITIPSIDVAGKDGSKIHLAGLAATHVDQGKIDALDVASVEGSGTDKGGPVAVKLGAIHFEGVDVARLLVSDESAAAALPPARLGGFTLAGLDVVAPDDAPGQSVHFAVGSIESHNDYDGQSIKHGETKISGVVVEPSPGSEAGKTLAAFGYSKLELGLTAAVKYQADAKTFTLENLTVDGAQMGAFGLSANFTDVAPALFGGDNGARMQAALEAGVASVEVKLVNDGLFEKALAFTAKQQNVSPDALRAKWSATIGQMAPLLLGGAPSTLAVAAEAQKFVAQPKNLTITVKAKSGALKAGDFMAITDPTEFAGKVDFAAAANR